MKLSLENPSICVYLLQEGGLITDWDLPLLTIPGPSDSIDGEKGRGLPTTELLLALTLGTAGRKRIDFKFKSTIFMAFLGYSYYIWTLNVTSRFPQINHIHMNTPVEAGRLLYSS